jgi:hypothetical protein
MRIFTMRWPRGMTRLAFLSIIAVCLFSAAGCGTGGSVVPSDEVARTALEKALTTWRDGGKPGALKGEEPPVQVHDTPWSQGERLGSYEILREDTGAAEKRFTVRLSLAKPERVEEVQYYVLGKAPVMVFRDQDYMRNINMEDGPKLNRPGTSKALRKR